MKVKSSNLISILLIALMLGSTISYTFLQVIFPSKRITLPKENIINYKLGVEVEDYAIRLGKTIVTLNYTYNCSLVEDCSEVLNFLENYAKSYKDQIILEKILSNSFYLKIRSYYGEKRITIPSKEKTLDALCDLMFKPPIECATREI